MRIIALDYGDATIGVAVSDDLGITAQGVGVIRRVGIRKDINKVLEHVKEYGASEIVVGLPRSMDGSMGTRAEKTVEFAEKLMASTDVPVKYYDERLSTAMAERMLVEADVSRKKRKQVIDMIAAQVILQGYLASMGTKLGPLSEDFGDDYE